MIVIAIVGILTTVAIPAYSDYLIRSRVVEVFNAAAPYQKQVEQQLVINGTVNIQSISNHDSPYIDTIDIVNMVKQKYRLSDLNLKYSPASGSD